MKGISLEAPAVHVLQLLSNPGVGGTETFVAGLSAALTRLGQRVLIVNLWESPVVRGRIQQADVRYIELGCTSRRIGIRALTRLRRILADRPFDVACAYGLRTSIALRLVGRTLPARPALVTGLRGLDQWRRPWHVWADRATQRLMDRFVGNSEAVCKMRRRRERTPSSQLVCIPNAVDTRHFSREAGEWPSRQALGLPDGLLCLTVANLRDPKGHAFLLDVIEHMQPLPNDIHFVWVGDGPNEGGLRARVKELGLTDRVHFYGAAADVRPLLAASDLFLLPSREEGMPRALMEAMSMGLPSIATDVGGTGEVLRDGTDGFLAAYGDTGRFAELVHVMATDSGLRRRCGENARARVRGHFDTASGAQAYASLFTELARQRRARIGVGGETGP